MSDNKNVRSTKADAILTRLDKLAKQTSSIEARLNSVIKTSADNNQTVIRKLEEENEGLRQEVHFLSAQIESVYNTLAKTVKKLSDDVARAGATGPDVDELASLIAAKIVIPDTAKAEVDADEIADKVAARLPERETTAAVPVDLDYDAVGFAVAKNIYIPQAVAEEIDYDALAQKIAAQIAPQTATPVATPVAAAVAAPVQAELDYDLLAAKVAEAVSVQEAVSPDYIASKVAEQIVIPEYPANVGEATFASVASVAAPDEQALAEDIASRLNLSFSDELIAAAVVKNLADAIDSDEIADCVAKRVGTVSPEQFDVMVDEDGCDSLAKAVESKLDYDVIAASVAEKLNPAFMAQATADEVDTEELARAISEKLSVNANLNEDVLADKAAAVLSNYLPEVDTVDIADKVVAGVIPSLPAPVVDADGIASAVAEKVVESQEDGDYDIVIDEEGISLITENVSSQIRQETEARFDQVDGRFDRVEEEIAEIKRLLLGGAIVAAAETVVADASAQEQTAEEELVTVSDLVGDEEDTEEEAEQEESLVEEIDESPAEGEIMPDGIDEASGGVDFANMMKYNRSFIARIIQGTDEQKNYYGAVKTALLSYKKVNSNVAWGAERFNKGRETIARFKIRGKTLCLYLALDPNEFETSVYHQADVSDNKSMHGTPMMVKIKSPRGVKKAIRLIDIMLERRNGEKRAVQERDYAAMYPYETIEELIEDGLVKDVSKK